MSNETDNSGLTDQPSCTNVLEILLRKDLVSWRPTAQRGQGSDPECIRAHAAHPGYLRNGACTFKEPSSAMANCKEEFTLSLVSQPDTRTQNLCTFSALSSLTFSSATWRHQGKSCSFPDKQINAALFQITVWWSLFISF